MVTMTHAEVLAARVLGTVGLLYAFGCGTSGATEVGAVDSTTSTSSMTVGTQGSTTSDDGTSSTSGGVDTSTGPDGPPDHVPPGFLNPTDVGPASFMCSPWVEDCPPGEKCMPYDANGGGSWNARRCVPIAPDAGSPGDPCTVEGGPASGFDSCGLHSICWDVDQDSLEGTCRAFCAGKPDTPTCTQSGHYCSLGGEGLLPLCLPQCDPLAQDCPLEGQGCYAQVKSGRFVCAADASGADAGADLSPCRFINACDAGLHCAEFDACGPGSSSCCAPFCDLANPDCPADRTCTSLFEPRDAPVGASHIGFCGDPP